MHRSSLRCIHVLYVQKDLPVSLVRLVTDFVNDHVLGMRLFARRFR